MFAGLHNSLRAIKTLHVVLLVFYVGSVDAISRVVLVRTVQVKEYIGCSIKLPFHQEGITVNVTGKGLITLNGYLDVDEDVGNLTQLSISVEKCRSLADRGSCEFFTASNFDNPCKMLKARGTIWTPIFDNIKPRLSCPFKKGRYVLQESTLDPTLLSRLIKPGEFWRASLKVFAGKRLVSCFKMGFELVEIRKRSK